MAGMPKYIQEANDILAVLEDQPNHEWRDTQKELAKLLDMPQSVLSLRIKLLLEHGRVRRGEKLPMRGKNHVIELIDSTPFEGPVQKPAPTYHPDDRVLEEDEETPPVVLELGDFTPDKIGMAVLRTLHEFWEKEQVHRKEREQLETAARTFREHLNEEHRLAQKLAKRNQELEHELEDAKNSAMDLRRQMNEMIIRNGRERRETRHRVSDILDDESRAMLKELTS